MRRATRAALAKSLILTLSFSFAIGPEQIARASETSAQWQRQGASSPAGALLEALDELLFRRCYALGADDLVLSEVPDAFLDLEKAQGTVLPMASANAAVTVNLGFTFPFYGSSYTQVAVTSKGYLRLGGAVVQATPVAFPTESVTNGIVAPFWEDLDPTLNPSSKVLFFRRGDVAGKRAFVVQWTDVPFKGEPSSRLTFEAVLLESGEIQFHYGKLANGDGSAVGRASGSRASVGVSSPDGLRGSSVAFKKEGALAQGRSFAFTPGGVPITKGELRGDLDRDGRVSVLDQSRLAEIATRNAKYAQPTARELILTDVAPASNPGNALVDVADRDLMSQVIVRRTRFNPLIARPVPEAVAAVTTLTLEGSGFALTPEKNKVTFRASSGGSVTVAASGVDAAGTALTVIVPSEAASGTVRVVSEHEFARAGGVTDRLSLASNSVRFYVAGRPEITALFPTAAAPGEEVQLRGVEFAPGSEVLVGGVLATVVLEQTADLEDRIVFRVPAGVSSGTSSVVVRSGAVSSAPFPFDVADDPVAVLTAPTDGQEVLGPVEIMGTAANPSPANFASYTLSLARQVEGVTTEPAVIGSGTTPVVAGRLGTLDPTILMNGFYTLKLTVTNRFGREATALAGSLQVRGDQKVGVFTLTFQDISIPVAGLPVTVVRTYDSREKRSQDFGYGWRLTLSNVDVEKDLAQNVVLTLPDGKREVFRFQPEATSNSSIYRPKYVGSPGVFDVLTPPDSGIDLFFNFGFWLTIQGEIFDPEDYTLTRKDGTVLAINKTRGLDRITDPNGNTITFNANGVFSDQGVSLGFTRDAKGRVTKITDPAGSEVSYSYDERGDLVLVKDRTDRTTEITYDPRHNLIDIIDGRGVRAARSDYDDAGRLVATTDADGKRTIFSHDVSGRRETITDRLGKTRVVEYNTNGDVTLQRDPLGHETKFEYDNARNQTAMIDALGHRWERTFDGQGNMLTDKDPLGNTTTRTYDGNGRVLTVKDPRGSLTTNVYDLKGNLTSTTDAAGATTTFGYDIRGNLRRRTDHFGKVTAFSYDDKARLVETVDALGQVTQYKYDILGNQILGQQGIPVGPYVFIPLRATASTYDKSGRLTGTRDILGNLSQIEYDENGHQSATIDPLQRRTWFEFDTRGNQVATHFPDGTSTSATFDEESRRKTSKDQAGRVTGFDYDDAGRLVKTTFPDLTSTISEFDAVGRVTTQTNARGFKTSFVYDKAGRREKVIDALGNETSFTFDEAGNVLTTTDALGHTVTNVYDKLNRQTKTIFSDQTYTEVTFDLLGRKSKERDQAGNETTFEFDDLGRQTKVIDAELRQTRFVFNLVGDLIERWDPENRVTKFDYDPLGRLTKTTRPMGQAQTVAYDSVGRVTSFTNFKGEQIGFVYDLASRLQRKTLPDGRTVTFGYTAVGQRQTITDSVRGVTSFAFDNRDRLLSRTEPGGAVVSYTWDENGNRKSVTAPSGVVSYTFDQLDRLETVAAANGTTTYAYTKVGSRRTCTTPNGVTTTYGYDDQHRLVTLAHTKGVAVLASYTYTLGPAGNRIGLAEHTGRQLVWTYDKTYRLTSESIFLPGQTNPLFFGWEYDKAGNRKKQTMTPPVGASEVTTYAYNDNDQLTSETKVRGVVTETTTYSYDLNGSTISKIGPSGSTSFTWTAERRLKTATVTPSAGQVVNLAFVYDEDGIRVEKIRNGDSTRFLIDQAQSYQQVLEERDASGALKAGYVYGDDLISQSRAGGERFYVRDGQLSTRALTDGAGAVTDTYDFEAFGLLLASTGSTENAYRYTGEQEDADVGAYYLRARYYSPGGGRFLSEDFRTNDGASYHRYLYTRNTPVNARDPSGLVTLLEAIVVGAIVSLIVSFFLLPAGEEALVTTRELAVERGLDTEGINNALFYSMAAGYVSLATNAAGLAKGLTAVGKAIPAIGSALYKSIKRLGPKIWKMPAFLRGQAIEYALTATKYKNAYHVGAEFGGYFPRLDFQLGNRLISLKSSNGSAASVNELIQHLDDLVDDVEGLFTKTGKRLKHALELDVQVPAEALKNPGDLLRLQSAGKARGIKVTIEVFPPPGGLP